VPISVNRASACCQWGQGGVRALWVERMAEDHQGISLAEAVAGVALDRQGPPGMLDGPMGLVLLQLEAGEGGQRLAFEEPVAGPAGEGEGLLGAAERLVKVVEALVGGGQPDEGDDLGIAGLRLPGQTQCLLVVVDRLLVLGQAVPRSWPGC